MLPRHIIDHNTTRKARVAASKANPPLSLFSCLEPDEEYFKPRTQVGSEQNMYRPRGWKCRAYLWLWQLKRVVQVDHGRLYGQLRSALAPLEALHPASLQPGR